jgi:hypothetical protein
MSEILITIVGIFFQPAKPRLDDDVVGIFLTTNTKKLTTARPNF